MPPSLCVVLRRILRLIRITPLLGLMLYCTAWARYDENLECGFDETRLNVAIHVRMGDRRAYENSTAADYFKLLEQFMETVTEEVVVGKGLSPPVFHVFSETVEPCPAAEAGAFEEFPAWPVEDDQVRKSVTSAR